VRTILIVGAGFSGVACAVQLLRQAGTTPLRVLLLERRARHGPGLPYGAQHASHLLNVPAGNMSALDDDPQHFLRFVQARDAGAGPASFVARSVYGEYLGWLLQQASAQAPATAQLQCVSGQAVALQRAANGSATVTLGDGRLLQADQVVLALGHFPARDPALPDMTCFADPRYQRDPWDSARLAALAPAQTVLLLGSGQTAVDIALDLLRRHPARRVLAVSRHGLLPQGHRASKPAAPPALAPAAIWGQAATVRAQMRGLRRHLQQLAAGGGDWRDTVAALRPHTAAIWQAWPAPERQRFLRHVQAYWDVHRHRLAPAVQDELAALLADGRLQVMAARLQACRMDSESVRLIVRLRGSPRLQELRAGWLVNCTGNCAGPAASDDPLVRQLLEAGWLRGEHLGLSLTPACAGWLYYVGPWLKAQYWEATAVPELRRFAAQTAAALLAAGRE
jgi:uncharacterized NAD(P)/FAD-binding protein YdhS